MNEHKRQLDIANDLLAKTKEFFQRRLETLRNRLNKTEQERDGLYTERAHLIALLAAWTNDAVIAPAADADGWQTVYLNLDGVQASWHIARHDADLFEYVEHVTSDDPRAQWDGHTTEQKYRRIAALVKHKQ
jgi:hypothetical protein